METGGLTWVGEISAMIEGKDLSPVFAVEDLIPGDTCFMEVEPSLTESFAL